MRRRRRLVLSAVLALLAPVVAGYGLVAGSGPAVAAEGASVDLEVIGGGTLYGKVGDQVTIRATVINHGPDDAGNGEITYEYRAPGGTEFVGVFNSPPCTTLLARRYYRCLSTGQLPGPMSVAGDSDPQYAHVFTLKIVSTKTSPGWVSASLDRDPNSSNNSTSVQVVVEGAATPQPPPTPAASPSVAPGGPTHPAGATPARSAGTVSSVGPGATPTGTARPNATTSPGGSPPAVWITPVLPDPSGSPGAVAKPDDPTSSGGFPNGLSGSKLIAVAIGGLIAMVGLLTFLIVRLRRISMDEAVE
jgi:hypothetical protein